MEEFKETGRKLEAKFISKVGMYHPPPFTFILQGQEQAYLNIASIHLGVKVECEIRNSRRT